MVVTAYSPLSSPEFTKDGSLFTNDIITRIASKHNATPAQIVLAWNLHRGVVVIPKTTNNARLGENIESLNIKISDEEYQEILSLNKG